jgi:hypothetical protein
MNKSNGTQNGGDIDRRSAESGHDRIAVLESELERLKIENELLKQLSDSRDYEL